MQSKDDALPAATFNRWKFKGGLAVGACILGEKNLRTRYNILNFPALFLTLVGLQICLPGRYYSIASAEKSVGKFKMIYRVLTLRFFLLKCML